MPNLWSELRWAARTGAVEHLDDLMLRRVRIGMLLPQGALETMERVRAIVQPELGWDDTRWQEELARYTSIYQKAYSPSPVGF
jgi:glycerol-3-phosphate dehydrogenase